MPLQFEWDKDKADSNVAKHGVTFDEAGTVFGDPLAVIFDDEEYSVDEIREIIMGHSVGLDRVQPIEAVRVAAGSAVRRRTSRALGSARNWASSLWCIRRWKPSCPRCTGRQA